MTAVQRVLNALDERGLAARGSDSRGWVCQCPAHEDRVASLSISEGDDGRALVYCHAGCTSGDVVGALGLELRDLFSSEQGQTGTTVWKSRSEQRTRSTPRASLPSEEQLGEWRSALLASDTVVSRLGELRGWTRDAIERLGLGYDGQRVVFEIRDATGQLVGVARYLPGDRPNGDPKMRSDTGSERGLWPAPESLAGAGPVWICEGEPDGMSLASIGIRAVAVPGAAGWRSEWAERFTGRDVVICADCDEQGRRLAAQIADDLLLTAASVRALDLDSARSDALDVGDLVRDAAKQRPEALAELRLRLEGMADNVLPVTVEWPSLSARALPAFPVDALPTPVAAWVTETAEHTQTPVDLPALAALGVLSGAAIGGAVVDCGSWEEELGLYLLPAMPSGDRKSTVLRAATQPLRELERERADLAAPRIRELRARREVLDIRSRNLTKVAAKENVEIAERLEAEQDLATVSEELDSIGQPAMPRLLADDATPEALGGLLSKHGSIAVLAAESALIDNLVGRYSEGKANLHLVCAAYSGEPTTIDRKGHDPERLDRPLLTIALVVQPHVLEALISHPTARAQGLVARFAYVLPETRLGQRRINTDSVSRAATEAWAGVVRRVAKSADRTDRTLEETGSVSRKGVLSALSGERIVLSPNARQLLTELQERVEPRLGPTRDLHSIADWAARHHGRVARVAGLLHLCEHAASEPISEPTMRAALRIGDYLLAHGVAALTGPNEKMRRALSWLKTHGQPTVTVRDLHRGPVAGRGSAEQPELLAQALQAVGALRALPAGNDGPGRPKSPAYAVNPQLLGSSDPAMTDTRLRERTEERPQEPPSDLLLSPREALHQNGHQPLATLEEWPLATPEEEERSARALRLVGGGS